VWWCCWGDGGVADGDGGVSWPYLMYEMAQIRWSTHTMILRCQMNAMGFLL
jgi:hypothetical protein